MSPTGLYGNNFKHATGRRNGKDWLEREGDFCMDGWMVLLSDENQL